jgi:hypothetical protein
LWHLQRLCRYRPKAGKRFVQVRHQRRRADFAWFVRDLLKQFPQARRVHLVLDNLNTHNAKSLHETFAGRQARHLLRRIVWHPTPKHTSWLNMAEIEIAALTKQCLDRRLATLQAVQRESTAFARDRNRRCATINWTFTHTDARRAFPERYPTKLAG